MRTKSARTAAGPLVYLACAAAINVPFLVCHPGRPLVELPLVRSLVVGLVLFLLPGLPWVGVIIGRGFPARFRILWSMAASLLVLLGVLIAFRLAGRPPDGISVWTATWILTNAAVLLSALTGGPAAWGIRPGEPCWRIGGPLFLAGYTLFFFAATEVVPPQEDHDLDVVPGCYALLTRFEPVFVGDYHSIYQFAHPPLFHYWVAGSMLYFDRLEYLKFYDEATGRVQAAMHRRPPPSAYRTADNLAKGTGVHRVVAAAGPDYIIDPPLIDGSTRIPALEFERGVIGAYYERRPCFVESRTPTVFLAALTVALLGCWIHSMTGRFWTALLAASVYATSPEVFVRCGYAGYTAVSNFAALAILMTVDEHRRDRRNGISAACLLAGVLAGLANHKLVLLPAAVVVWRLIAPGGAQRRLWAAVLHPVVVGFFIGTAAFWVFALSVNPAAFWQDHVKTHFLDRLTHHNPLDYGGYPSLPGLWREFAQHTGYLLLPLAIGTLVLGCLAAVGPGLKGGGRSAGGTFALWAVWTLIVAVAFSLVDWRQTKHLMPLLLVFHAAPMRWAAAGRRRWPWIGALFGLLLLWNLWTLRGLATDFASFPITPAW